MTEDSRYKQYGYSQYNPQKAPVMPKGKRGSGSLISKLKSPLFAGAALLLTGAVFMNFVISNAPQNEMDINALPVIKADLSPIKVAPTDVGGMDILHRDSTVYSTMRSASLQEHAPEGQAVDPLKKFAEEVEQMDEFSDISAEEERTRRIARNKAAIESLLAEHNAVISGDVQEGAGFDTASSLDWKDDLRSVLQKKDLKMAKFQASIAKEAVVEVASVSAQVEAVKIAEIKPAAGADILQPVSRDVSPVAIPAATSAATPIVVKAPVMASYYVQLGSVPVEEVAESEWKRLSRIFAAELSDADYRIKSADLGERGTYYRIQAGPMSREIAMDVCDSIKLKKTGGCLVTR